MNHPIVYNNQRILTTQQVADFYDVEPRRIRENFNRNKDRYVLGKDYYILEGKELKKFKSDDLSNCEVVENNENDDNAICVVVESGKSNNNVNKLFLWTEWGCLLHAKSINTDKAWDVFFDLRTSYFQIHQLAQSSQPVIQPAQTKELEQIVRSLRKEVRDIKQLLTAPEQQPVSRQELKERVLEAIQEMQEDYPDGISSSHIREGHPWFSQRNYSCEQIWHIADKLTEQGLLDRTIHRQGSHLFSLPTCITVNGPESPVF